MARYYKGILIHEDPVMPVLDAEMPQEALVATPKAEKVKPIHDAAELQKMKKVELEDLVAELHVGLKADVEYTKKDLVDLILKAQAKRK